MAVLACSRSAAVAEPLLRRSVCAAGQPACSQVRRRIGLSGSDREFPALTGRSGTQRARRLRSRTTVGSLGALVLVTTQRPTHYEGVPMRCSRVQSPPQLHVRRLLLVAIVGY